jgi:hypothetical protein
MASAVTAPTPVSAANNASVAQALANMTAMAAHQKPPKTAHGDHSQTRQSQPQQNVFGNDVSDESEDDDGATPRQFGGGAATAGGGLPNSSTVASSSSSSSSAHVLNADESASTAVPNAGACDEEIDLFASARLASLPPLPSGPPSRAALVCCLGCFDAVT